MFDIGEKTLEDFQHGQISYGNTEINWGLASVDNEKPNPLVQCKYQLNTINLI